MNEEKELQFFLYKPMIPWIGILQYDEQKLIWNAEKKMTQK